MAAVFALSTSTTHEPTSHRGFEDKVKAPVPSPPLPHEHILSPPDKAPRTNWQQAMATPWWLQVRAWHLFLWHDTFFSTQPRRGI